MKEEIKEILELYKNDDIEYYNLVSDLGYDKLLDCIINLQEQLHQASLDIQELTEKDIGCPSWCDKLTNLQEENKLLRIHLNVMKEDSDNTQDRIDKAIEYITEDDVFYYGDELYDSYQEIVNILKGDKDE